MISVPFTSQNKNAKRVLNLKGLEDLNCSIYEVTENQAYKLAQNPLDDGSFVADTIYTLPKKIDVRVLVNNSDISTFIADLKACQFSNDMFVVTSLEGETFTNLKIATYTKTVTADMVDKTFYLISFEETLLVKALVESYKNSKNAGYGNNQNQGSKEPEKRKQSALKGFGL